jgi:hypothetical protein
LAAAGHRHGLLGCFGVALFLAQQGQGEQGPGVARKVAGQFEIQGRGLGLLTLLLLQVGQQHADG